MAYSVQKAFKDKVREYQRLEKLSRNTLASNRGLLSFRRKILKRLTRRRRILPAAC